MSVAAWISLAVVAAIFIGLQRRGASSDLLFMGGVVVLVLSGVLSPGDALAGFANPAVIVIGALFVVAAGLRATGVLDWIGHRVLGSARNERSAIPRLAVFEISLSAFIPNTPLVALLVPVVVDWCRQRGISPSRLLIPVSYLAVLGGVCSLIGTSTNLVVQGLLKQEQRQIERSTEPTGRPVATQSPAYNDPRFRHELRGMTLFEIGKVGLPCALVGAAFMLLFAHRLLPERTEMIEQLGEQRREYLVEMLVQPGCRLVGQEVEAAGLRHLQGLFLIEIDREGEVITPVTPSDVIHANDRLVFTGVVTTIVDLEKIPGLVPAADMTYEFSPRKRAGRHLTEVVLSSSSPLIGATVRAANFRQLYNAAVVAVHRNGERMTNKIGDIRLRPGDTLLLQTRTEFIESYRHSQDFSLVSRVEGSRARRTDRAWLAALFFVLLVVWLSFEGGEGPLPEHLTNPAIAAVAIAGLMVATRCLPMAEARASIDVQVLLTIGAALALGKAMTSSGAAKYLAEHLVGAVGAEHPYLLLIVVYVLALILTEMLSNSAVAVLMFPLVVAMAAAGGFSPRPFIMGITLAASLSFMTPIGYQTNLMVMGPGGYRPSDFFRIGLPLTALVTITALALIPLMWPFTL